MGFAPAASAALALRNVLIVDPDGGGQHTTIQAAITAAAAPSVTSPWLVLIAGGAYSEALTNRSHVHLAALGNGSVRITLSSAMTVSTITTFTDITFDGAGTYMTVTGASAVFAGCNFGTTAGSQVNLNTGSYRTCTFTDVSMRLGGADFTGCKWRSSPSDPLAVATITEQSSSSASTWAGGEIDSSTEGEWFDLGSGHSFSGCKFRMRFIPADGFMTIASQFDGCTFTIDQPDGEVAMRLIGGALFTGCTMVFSSNPALGDMARISIEDLSDVISFAGCTLRNENSPVPLVRFGVGLTTVAAANPLKISGTTFQMADVTGAINIFVVDSGGFTGTVTVDLNGNIYRGGQSSLPVTAGAGRIRWRGVDFQTVFFPVVPGVGTGAAVIVDNIPVQQLDTVAETAYVTGRFNPPGGLLVDAQLIVSADLTGGIEFDTFTDVNGTNLSAHASDSGGAWTAQAGAITIESNRARVTPTALALYTYSVTSRDGYMHVPFDTFQVPTGGYIGFLFRWADSNNYWRLIRTHISTFVDETQLIKRVAGVETVLFTIQVDITGDDALALSFVGSRIRVWDGGVLHAEIEDSDLAANTGVGVVGIDPPSLISSMMEWNYYPGSTVDITADGRRGQLNERFDQGATDDIDDVGVVHKVYSFVDVSGAFAFPVTNNPEEFLWGLEVTLDAEGAGLNALNVHGVLVRTLPITRNEFANAGIVPETGLLYR